MAQASSSPLAPASAQEPSSAPWWKFGYVWLVLSGPAIVVVAGFYTLYLAISTADPVYSDPPRVEQTQAAESAASRAAMQARNHAATGGVVNSADKKDADQP